jgi:hypothetical protein
MPTISCHTTPHTTRKEAKAGDLEMDAADLAILGDTFASTPFDKDKQNTLHSSAGDHVPPTPPSPPPSPPSPPTPPPPVGAPHCIHVAPTSSTGLDYFYAEGLDIHSDDHSTPHYLNLNWGPTANWPGTGFNCLLLTTYYLLPTGTGFNC